MKGEGNSLNYTFRMHDPRVGRFFAVDPLFKEYPELSTYQFSSNSPIDMVELEGMEGGWFVENNKAVYHQGYAYIKGFDSEEAALKAAARGFKTPKEQANAEKSLQQWLSRTPKVQRSVETLRCACAVCFQKANSNHYLAAHDPVMRESAMYILTGGTANFLFKALPKVKIITKAGEAYSKLSVTEKVTYKVGFNVASQTIANKGDIKKVNVVEAIASGIKGRPAVILGESAKLSVQDALDG